MKQSFGAHGKRSFIIQFNMSPQRNSSKSYTALIKRWLNFNEILVLNWSYCTHQAEKRKTIL